jgi:hypothetical protein
MTVKKLYTLRIVQTKKKGIIWYTCTMDSLLQRVMVQCNTKNQVLSFIYDELVMDIRNNSESRCTKVSTLLSKKISK